MEKELLFPQQHPEKPSQCPCRSSEGLVLILTEAWFCSSPGWRTLTRVTLYS